MSGVCEYYSGRDASEEFTRACLEIAWLSSGQSKVRMIPEVLKEALGRTLQDPEDKVSASVHDRAGLECAHSSSALAMRASLEGRSRAIAK